MSKPSSAEIDAAVKYWGALLKPHGLGATAKLEDLLLGLALCVSRSQGGIDGQDLLPSQLQDFYRNVGGDYHNLFSLPNESLEHVYTKLRCSYSLQPDPAAGDDFVHPTIPALKRDGFLKWFVVQILLGPDEHALFLQNALKRYDIRDPQTGKPFPMLLPRQLLPEHPHEEMTRWHQQISDEMYREALAAQKSSDRKHGRGSFTPDDETESDHKHLAATYFSNPHYRDTNGRPTILRQVSRSVSNAMQMAKDFAKDVIDPNLFGGRRHSVHGHAHRRHSNTSDDSNDSAKPPNEQYPRTSHRDERRSRPVHAHAQESDPEPYQDRRRQRQAFGRQRSYSHEPAQSPRHYVEDRPQQAYDTSGSTPANRPYSRSAVFVPANLPTYSSQANRLQHSHARAGVNATDYFNFSQRSTSRPIRVVSQPEWKDEQDETDSDDSGTSPTGDALPPPPRAFERRPGVQRQGTPVMGVHGRQYINAAPWKKR